MNLEQFVNRHYEYIKSCFRISGLSKEDVEDSTHDLILQLGETKQDIPEKGIRGWIFAVVRNKVKTIRRTTANAPIFESLSIEHEQIVDFEPSEQYREVLQDAAVSEAWPGTYIIELLCDLDFGLSIAEAARMRGIDYQRYSRALRLWKEKIQNVNSKKIL